MPDKLRLFISYSHIDKSEKERLQVHLANLERTHNIQIWADHMINAGQDWDARIFDELRSSHFVLLLISPDFIASDFAYKKELGEAIALHENKKAMLIPIMLKSVKESGHPFSSFQTLPTNPRYLSEWPDQDAAFTDIIKGLEISINEFVKNVMTRDILCREKELVDFVLTGNILNAIDRLLDFTTEFSNGNSFRIDAISIKGSYNFSINNNKGALDMQEIIMSILKLIEKIKNSPHNA